MTIPSALIAAYVTHLASRKVPSDRVAEYKKWVRYFLDFCDKYPVPSGKAEKVCLFCEKLKEKKQSDEQRKCAAHAVSLYFEMQQKAGDIQSPSPEVTKSGGTGNGWKGNELPDKAVPAGPQSYYVSEDAPRYSTCASRKSQYTEAGYQEKSASPEWDAALERMAAEIKVRHYSRKTLQTYALWSRNFQRFLKDKPPGELATQDAREYLTFLAVKCKVASSTQNQAVKTD